MTEDQFRNLALDLPETDEGEHMNHPDFRVRGKIFATLGPAGQGWGMLKLDLAQQAALVAKEPGVYEPIKGAWGRRGATRVRLSAARVASLRPALLLAWRNCAPRDLADPDPGD